jgi:phage repressor protein C with HTH and peptisase S24 domain
MTKDIRRQIGERILFAQKRKYRFGSDAIEELERLHGKKVRAAYYSHRRGTKLADDDTLRKYADLFEVPFEYLRLGIGAEEIERQPEQINEDESEGSITTINQGKQQTDLKSSHKLPIRFIPILSADQIRDLSFGRGGLAQMSGRTLPVPDFLNVSPDSYAYLIAQNDYSMVVASGPSYGPGTCIVLDPQRTILPGDVVLADIEGFGGPVIRKFVAARAFTPGLKFRLEAFNPAFEAIEIADPAELSAIARVIWIAQQI